MGMKVNGTSGLTFPDTTTLASAGQASVRAWVNFNGIGTVAVRASYNVASITDNGTGDYTVNFTTAMPDANYATLPSIEEAGILIVTSANNGFQQTSGAARIGVYLGTSNTKYDPEQVNVAIFR